MVFAPLTRGQGVTYDRYLYYLQCSKHIKRSHNLNLFHLIVINLKSAGVGEKKRCEVA